MRVTDVRWFAQGFSVAVWGHGTAVEVRKYGHSVAFLQGDEAAALLDEIDAADEPELILDQFVPTFEPLTEEELNEFVDSLNEPATFLMF